MSQCRAHSGTHQNRGSSLSHIPMAEHGKPPREPRRGPKSYPDGDPLPLSAAVPQDCRGERQQNLTRTLSHIKPGVIS